MKLIVGILILGWVGSAFSCLNPEDVEACDGGELVLKCPDGYGIRILQVFYGRDDQTTCTPASIGTTSCSDPNAKQTVVDECEGDQSCTIPVSSPSTFAPDPCPGTDKYLRVRFSCCKDFGDNDPDHECVRKPVPIRPVVGDCVATNTVYFGRCEGGCPSDSHYEFGTGQVAKKCTCCVPKEIRRASATLKCANGNSLSVLFFDVGHCDCEPCDEPKEDDCHVDKHEITPTWGDCVGDRPVDVGKCHGGCPSSVSYPFGTNRPRQACDCCTPKITETHVAVLRCRTFPGEPDKWIKREYRKITHCDCTPCKKRPTDYINLVSAADAKAVEEQSDASADEAAQNAAQAAAAARRTAAVAAEEALASIREGQVAERGG